MLGISNKNNVDWLKRICMGNGDHSPPLPTTSTAAHLVLRQKKTTIVPMCTHCTVQFIIVCIPHIEVQY